MAGRIKKQDLEYRYYRMPSDMYVFALLGDAWVREYGVDGKGKRIETLHFHNFLEIGYCIDGSGEMILNKDVHAYKKGNFTVIPGKYPHTTNSKPGTKSSWEYLFIDVEGILKSLYNNKIKLKKMDAMIALINRNVLFSDGKTDKNIADSIKRLMDILRYKKPFYEEEAHGSLISLLIKIARKAKTRDSTFTSEKDVFNDKIPELLEKATDYISKNYTMDIKVSNLAKYLYISEVHLRRIFDKYMKMGVLDYINLVRINEACKLLQKSTENIEDISGVCGFNNISTFNRNFKKIMGLTPKDWRKNTENHGKNLLEYNILIKESWQ